MDGFTLLETAVAFAIAALAVAALVHGAMAGLTTTAVAARTEQALSRAQSRLAALGEAPLAPGDRQGDDGGGFRWHERIRPLATAPRLAPPARADGGVTLYAVSVAISWQGHAVTLQTQRVGAGAVAAP